MDNDKEKDVQKKVSDLMEKRSSTNKPVFVKVLKRVSSFRLSNNKDKPSRREFMTNGKVLIGAAETQNIMEGGGKAKSLRNIFGGKKKKKMDSIDNDDEDEEWEDPMSMSLSAISVVSISDDEKSVTGSKDIRNQQPKVVVPAPPRIVRRSTMDSSGGSTVSSLESLGDRVPRRGKKGCGGGGTGSRLMNDNSQISALSSEEMMDESLCTRPPNPHPHQRYMRHSDTGHGVTVFPPIRNVEATQNRY